MRSPETTSRPTRCSSSLRRCDYAACANSNPLPRKGSSIQLGIIRNSALWSIEVALEDAKQTPTGHPRRKQHPPPGLVRHSRIDAKVETPAEKHADELHHFTGLTLHEISHAVMSRLRSAQQPRLNPIPVAGSRISCQELAVESVGIRTVSIVAARHAGYRLRPAPGPQIILACFAGHPRA